MIKHINETAPAMRAQTLRTLNIDFDQYTEGDLGFKRELITLLVKNVREFVQSLSDSISKNNPEIFAEACHKSKITIHMLNDNEYNSIVRNLQADLANDNFDGSLKQYARRFAQVSAEIVASLNEEFTRSAAS